MSLRGGKIVIADRQTDEEVLRPLEDVQMIMIDHHSARITVQLINRHSLLLKRLGRGKNLLSHIDIPEIQIAIIFFIMFLGTIVNHLA